MAKDRRKNRPARQVSLSAETAPKRQKSHGRMLVIVLLTVLMVVALVFLFFIGRYVYLQFFAPKEPVGKVDLTQFDTTPPSDQDKVAYYVLGVLGAEETDPMESLALICHDKQKNTLNILQIPRDTYLGESEQWAVKKAGDVWANPKPYDWCEICGKRLYSAEIADGHHTVCNGPVTQKTGSSVVNLMDVFNDQFSLPVDYYFLFSQESFVKLVNLFDGIDVELEEEMTVGGITYPKGVQTLAGDAALACLTQREEGVAGDVACLLRQREVFVSLFQRLFAASEKNLREDTLVPLMNGSTPIRTNLKPHSSDDSDDTDNMIQLVRLLAGIPWKNMTVYLLPGEPANLQQVTYFGVHRASLAALLNEAFNPVGRPIGEADLMVTEINVTEEADTHKQTLDTLQISQTGTAHSPEDTPSAA